jgi:hypothetical protein
MLPAAKISGEYHHALQRAYRQNAFREAARIEGPWRSHAPRALAEFLLATYLVVDAVDSDYRESSMVSCALNSFRKAAGYLQGTFEPQLSAVVFNNAAVARVFLRDNEKNIAVAKKWLTRASEQRDKDGSPVYAARVAMLNLQTLDRVFP